ncbi:MarR family transcriptional regulator [Lysobacter hankyongensis]|uniref:MarR family transcriptional regulator n=2 Tax=Lysobacter hankyongensis TaxID=1176535 RepID=A0ABP9BTK2_9GAMM
MHVMNDATKPPKDAADSLGQDPSRSGSQLGLLFKQVRDAMWARMAHELSLAGHELTFSQYIALKRLSEGEASATELARATELNPGAITRLLDRLEEKGFTQRIADPEDRRALRVTLTEAGRLIWADIHRCGLRVRACALEGMSDEEQQRLLRQLAQVRDNLNREDV